MGGKRFFDRNIRIWYTYKNGCTRPPTARAKRRETARAPAAVSWLECKSSPSADRNVRASCRGGKQGMENKVSHEKTEDKKG